jgi:hypothetical protein
VKKQDTQNVDSFQAKPKEDVVIDAAKEELKDEIESQL